MGYIVYILVEYNDRGQPVMMKRPDGGVYLFNDGMLSEKMARAFQMGGRNVGVISIDLRVEIPSFN